MPTRTVASPLGASCARDCITSTAPERRRQSDGYGANSNWKSCDQSGCPRLLTAPPPVNLSGGVKIQANDALHPSGPPRSQSCAEKLENPKSLQLLWDVL